MAEATGGGGAEEAAGEAEAGAGAGPVELPATWPAATGAADPFDDGSEGILAGVVLELGRMGTRR